MRSRDDKTRYGLPPEGDPFEPFPTEVPWDRPISEMPRWWLHVTALGGSSARIPLRLLAGQYGWDKTLREIVPKLSRAGVPPVRVLLISEGGLEISRNPGKWLVLV